MISIVLTDEQALNLRGLIDLAVKSSGSRVMRHAIEIDDLIVRAAQQEQERAQATATEARPKNNGGKEALP
jgi:hypothetical protein